MREQLESAPRGRLKKRRRIPWMWGAAAASAAVSGVALARTLVARRIASLRARLSADERGAGSKRAGGKRRASGKQRAAPMAQRTNGTGAPPAKTPARRSAPKKSRQSVATTRKSSRGKQSSARR